jgi:hypothetical protein
MLFLSKKVVKLRDRFASSANFNRFSSLLADTPSILIFSISEANTLWKRLSVSRHE